jgi:hypothetical protein
LASYWWLSMVLLSIVLSPHRSERTLRGLCLPPSASHEEMRQIELFAEHIIPAFR